MNRKAEEPGNLHPVEGAADAALPATPLAALLASHVLRDGETIILLLKPSLWFIAIGSFPFAAGIILLLMVVRLFHPLHTFSYYEAGAFLLVGRVVWAVLQWTARLYVLTDLRVLRVSGFFAPDIFDCPLRKVAGVMATGFFKDRLLMFGSVEIQPRDPQMPAGAWQTIRNPNEVSEKILEAIHKLGPQG